MTSTPTSQVTGPVTGGERGWPFGASMLDIQALGYSENEFFLEGVATRFQHVSGTQPVRDGYWQAQAAGTAPFKTRLIVYRPIDPAHFNGTVIVTWNNVTAGHDLFGTDSLEIFEGGFALVCVTTQKAGIEGLPPFNQGLATWDAQRYGSLSIPSDDFSYDLFTQAALAIGPQRNNASIDPLNGLQVQHVVAQGASQSAARLATYINAIAPLNNPFDGFILAIYFGNGSGLKVGDTVININEFPETESVMDQLRGRQQLRDDLGVPIFVVNSELEAIACYDVRQADTDTFRYWESAGTCHLSQQIWNTRQKMAERDGMGLRIIIGAINDIPMNPLYDAVFYHMHRWLLEHIAPPVQPRIEFAGDALAITRDELGIARGGLRLPQADVPLAQNSAIPLGEDIFSFLAGSCHLFTREKAESLYGNCDNFLDLFEQAALKAIASGVLRPRDLSRLIEDAENRWADLN